MQGSNNTFLGANTQFMGGTYIDGSIALGEGATINAYNQLKPKAERLINLSYCLCV